MPKSISALTRRSFLKGMAYTTVVSFGGVSCVALAMQGTSEKDEALVSGGNGTEVVELINHTSSVITLPTSQGAEVISIKPGQQRSFVIPATQDKSAKTTNNKNVFIKDVLIGKLAIESNSEELSGIYADSFFNALAA